MSSIALEPIRARDPRRDIVAGGGSSRADAGGMNDTNTPQDKPRSTPTKVASALAALAMSLGLAAGACSGSPPPEPQTGDAPAEGEGEQTLATGINATVIVSKCPDAARVNIRTAQDAIQRLVGPCAKVPGGSAHFSAKLMPGGRIELASPEGDPSEGVVPTCVLKNRLVHRVLLRSPCTLDVQLDERTVVVERQETDGGAGDASPDAQ